MSWDGSPPLGLISYLACGGALWIRLLAVTLILKKCQLLADQKKRVPKGSCVLYAITGCSLNSFMLCFVFYL